METRILTGCPSPGTAVLQAVVNGHIVGTALLTQGATSIEMSHLTPPGECSIDQLEAGAIATQMLCSEIRRFNRVYSLHERYPEDL